jgi:hypothetical protein
VCFTLILTIDNDSKYLAALSGTVFIFYCRPARGACYAALLTTPPKYGIKKGLIRHLG